MNFKNEEEAFDFFTRLLERLHQADYKLLGSININIYKEGSQHVDHVENQYFYGDTCRKSTKTSKEKDESATKTFDDETPLSALFRDNHHEEVRKVIESWRPYLDEEGHTEDNLVLTLFQFDLTKIRPVNIYMDLAHLINHDALCVPMSVLAAYMFRHSNLSKSEKALYVQLKRYRSMCK